MSFTIRFDGEAGHSREQKAEQKQQQRVWLEMQIREKKMAKDEDKNVERTWQEIEHSTAQRAKALAKLEDECRKKLMEANHRYNQALVSVQTILEIAKLPRLNTIFIGCQNKINKSIVLHIRS